MSTLSTQEKSLLRQALAAREMPMRPIPASRSGQC